MLLRIHTHKEAGQSGFGSIYSSFSVVVKSFD
jgi:hypothetical protein